MPQREVWGSDGWTVSCAVSCVVGAGPGTESACHTLCLQCVEELSALLRSQALLLPALKLLLESPDARLHAVALEHVAAVTQVYARPLPGITLLPGLSPCGQTDRD